MAATLAVIRSRSSLTNIVKKLDHSSKMLTTVSSSLRRVASKFAGTCSPRPSRTYFNHANVFRIRSSPLFFGGCRSESTVAEVENGYQAARDSTDEDRRHQHLEFPGGKVGFTSEMRFLSESEERVDCFRVLDDNGRILLGSSFDEVSKEIAVEMYTKMVTLQVMDTIFYEAQRQGRISFYLTCKGEEGINIASASALTIDDIIFPQYREQGVLLWRGFSLQEFANQCFGNCYDYGKGRQMPIHYGSKKLNYFTVSSTIATQIPQAVGAAYSLKMDKKNACVVTYFGDGGTSTGDFHAGMNFAAVLDAPIVFFCRNNGWAISTPTSEQFRSDGAVVKGKAYGIRSIRVDGNDVLAVYRAVHAAREMAISESMPIFVEALTYRVGHHSTSDDSTKYRPIQEIEHWRTARDPISKFRKWIQRNGWWNDSFESELRIDVRKEVLKAIQLAEKSENLLLKTCLLMCMMFFLLISKNKNKRFNKPFKNILEITQQTCWFRY